MVEADVMPNGPGGLRHRPWLHGSDKGEPIAVIRPTIQSGVTFFDTVEVDGSFRNEELVGEALAPVRKDFVSGGKLGHGLASRALNSRPEHIQEVAEASVKRLRVEVTDFCCQHRVDSNVQMGDVADAVTDLIAQGKMKHFGLSEASAPTDRRAHAIQPVAAIQGEYSGGEGLP